MSAEYRYAFSDGKTFHSVLEALLHLKRNPTLTAERTLHGLTEDVTKNLLAILNDHPYGEGRR